MNWLATLLLLAIIHYGKFSFTAYVAENWPGIKVISTYCYRKWSLNVDFFACVIWKKNLRLLNHCGHHTNIFNFTYIVHVTTLSLPTDSTRPTGDVLTSYNYETSLKLSKKPTKCRYNMLYFNSLEWLQNFDFSHNFFKTNLKLKAKIND